MTEQAQGARSPGRARAVGGISGQRIRFLRITRVMLTQEELAARVGVSRAEISHLENGKRLPLLKTFRSLCEALGCEAGDIMEESSDARDQPI